jgi:hypothetical protein
METSESVSSDALWQLSVLVAEVELYSAPFFQGLRPRSVREGLDDEIRRFMGDSPNKLYEKVIVKGANTYKNYKGVIRSTNTKGEAWVELEAMNEKVVQFHLKDLWMP